MRLEEMNWMDVEAYLQQDDRLMLVIGACEQHGYLSLLTDVRIPLALADAASQRSGVPVAPPLNFGASPYFLDYPGTLSLRLSTLLAVVEDLVRSAYRQGFRRLLVLNGHGGNNGAKTRLRELANELTDLHMQWYDWWLSHSVEAVARRYERKPTHANWVEAFPFTRVVELPQADKTPPVVPSEILSARQARQIYGDGSFGGAYVAPEEVFQEIFEAALQDILMLLEFHDQAQTR